MKHLLNKGTWIRPTDKSAVYTEYENLGRWGIRVTLFGDSAKVEALARDQTARYKAPKRLAATVHPPSWFEKLRGISFEDKIMDEVHRKRRTALEENTEENRNLDKDLE